MSMNFKRPPETFDGKQLVTANALPEWCILNQIGRGDADDAIGGGPFFMLSNGSVSAPATLEFHLIDACYVTSGVGVVQDAKIGDYLRFEVFAPPTVGEAAPSGDGNCNKVPTGQGFDIFVPGAPGGCYWSLDLESYDCHLVPNQDGTGFWDCDVPNIGSGTITPNYTQEGQFDLYSIGMRLNKFATDVPILGTDIVLNFGISNVRAKMIPPHWHWLVSLFRGAATPEHTVNVAFYLQVGRARSYLPTQIPMVP